jgi:uncharacterized Tic20 family protein
MTLTGRQTTQCMIIAYTSILLSIISLLVIFTNDISYITFLNKPMVISTIVFLLNLAIFILTVKTLKKWDWTEPSAYPLTISFILFVVQVLFGIFSMTYPT